MKNQTLITVLSFLWLYSANCQTISEKDKTNQNDTIILKETSSQEDIPINEYLTVELKPIRENFKKLNSIENWKEIKVVDLWETTEGGEAKFYYQENELLKIVTCHFGETFQKLTEYYLKDGEVSFVFEKLYKYNRPIFYNSKAKEENNDTEEFDFDKSEIIEDRSYFLDGKLLHQLNNQDCGSPFAQDYLLEEQERLIEEFNRLKNVATEK